MPDIVIVLVIIAIIVLLWKGPKMLPEWGAAVGRTVREARSNATKGLDDDKKGELSDGGIDTNATTTPRRDTTNAPRT
jgi:Sec-independent protein translocase protein TatA